MKNRFYYYQLLDEREEQLFNKAGSESFYICIALSLLSYIISVLAPSLFNSNMLLIVIIIGTFYFFNRARYLGVTYYSRFHFTILGCFFLTLAITALLMLQNYQFNIEIYQHNPLNFKYLSAWSLLMSFTFRGSLLAILVLRAMANGLRKNLNKIWMNWRVENSLLLFSQSS